MNIEIRPISKNDVSEIISILHGAFNSPKKIPSDNEYIDDPNIFTFVSVIDKKIIGTATLHIIKKINQKVGLIEDVAVTQSHKGQGLGKMLVEKLLEVARLEGGL